MHYALSIIYYYLHICMYLYCVFNYSVRFEVLTVATISNSIIRGVMLCSLAAFQQLTMCALINVF
jgi:hypothetical protein